MRFLLDASAVLQLIKSFEEEKVLRIFADSYVLDLTKYEVGNGIWKEYVLHRAIGDEEFHEFLGLLRIVVARTALLVPNPQNLSDVAEIAAKEKITFYDASYITMAKIRKLALTTEDGRLEKIASKYGKTATTRDLAS